MLIPFSINFLSFLILLRIIVRVLLLQMSIIIKFIKKRPKNRFFYLSIIIFMTGLIFLQFFFLLTLRKLEADLLIAIINPNYSWIFLTFWTGKKIAHEKYTQCAVNKKKKSEFEKTTETGENCLADYFRKEAIISLRLKCLPSRTVYSSKFVSLFSAQISPKKRIIIKNFIRVSVNRGDQ